MSSAYGGACPFDYNRDRGRRAETRYARDRESHYTDDWQAGLHLRSVRGSLGDLNHHGHAFRAKVHRLHSELEIVVGQSLLFHLESRGRGRGRDHPREIAYGHEASEHVETGSRPGRGSGWLYLFCPDGQHRFHQKVAV